MPKNPHANFSPILDGYSGIGAFRFWCQTALPLTYDDSLSYYELLNKVVNYLNHTIEDLTAVESNTSALAEAYNQLQKYVNDYFDDLDVEAELRNVLDAMAEDGTLNALLDPIVENQLPGVVDEKIDGVVASQIDEAVAGQIDESVEEQLPPLVEAGVPEEVGAWLEQNVDPVGSAVLVDSSLTVPGAAADAKVTGDEIRMLKETLNDVDNIAYQKITATPATAYTDKILNYSGYVGNATGYNTSEAIDVDGFNAISLNYSLTVDNIGSEIWRAAMFFTSTAMGTGIVSDFGAVQENDKIIVPNGAKYLRISYLSATTPAVTKYKGNKIVNSAELNDNVAQFRDYNNDNIFDLDLNDLSIAVKMLKFAHYQNIVDSENNTPNKYLVQATGALSGNDNVTYFTTDFIEVNPGDTLYSFTQMRFIAGYATANVADYDSNSWSGQNTYSYTVPNGIKYVRITGYTADINIFTVLINSIPDGFIPHTYKLDSKYTELPIKRNYYNVKKDTMTANNYLLIDKKMPVKNDVIIQFSGNISGSFSGIEFGFTDNISAADTTHFKIDATKFYRVTNNPYEVEHGLTLSGNVAISIKQTFTHLDIDIECNGEKYHSSNGWSPINKKPYVKVLSGMTDCVFSWTTLKNNKNIVIFGDSYTSYGENRWIYYLNENGYADSIVISGFPGEQSTEGFENFENLMAVSSAKYVVWAYGMNDLDSNDTVNAIWKDRIDKVIKYCQDNNITPVLCTIPNVPTRSNVLKNNYVRSFIDVYPIIDFAKAVGSDITDTWFDGMLEPLNPPTVTERVHPTVIGAKALYNRAIADFPQLCVSD